MNRPLAGALMGAVLAVSGCGGSSTLSSDQLVRRATLLCTNAALRSARIATPSDPGDGATFLRRGIAILGPELTALRSLKAPKELAPVYATSIDSFSRKLGALRSAVHEMDTGANPVTAMTALQQRLAPIESAEDGAWRALEIPACVNR